MIKFSTFYFSYPQTSQPILVDVNLEIPSKTLTLVTGASGCGKSTLLRCINGLVPHFTGGALSGKIDVFGANPILEGPEKMSGNIGVVFQEPEAQFVFNRVEDEIAFSMENKGIPRPEMHVRMDQILAKLHITHLRNKLISQISGGEQQKVAIASALINQPQVLILDEPTSQLDPKSADELLRYIVSLKSELGLTVLISEHRLERLLAYSDAIIYLSPDKQCMSGSVQSMLKIMEQVPPLIEISRYFELAPLPVSPKQFSLPQKKNIINKNLKFKPSKSQQKKTDLLSIEKLSVSFNDQKILKNLTLTLKKGEILVLIGPNGSGKTTLLRSILGLIPSSGERYVLDVNLASIATPEAIQKMAYLPQNPNDLLFAETIIDEVKITLSNHQMNKSDLELVKFLERFDLEDKKFRYPRDLSVGERQRTAIAAISVHQPEIYLLDEPTRGLDSFAKLKLGSLLKNISSQGKSILLVTHDIEFGAKFADRAAILENGTITFSGSPQEIFSKYPRFQTQTAQLFPETGWITPKDIISNFG